MQRVGGLQGNLVAVAYCQAAVHQLQQGMLLLLHGKLGSEIWGEQLQHLQCIKQTSCCSIFSEMGQVADLMSSFKLHNFDSVSELYVKGCCYMPDIQ